jgi:hypothetical protein
MKKVDTVRFFLLVIGLIIGNIINAQQPVNWQEKDLIKPADLAKILSANENLPVIYNIGPSPIIPHSIDIGMLNDEKNMAAFREQISKLPKSTDIVVYCGCCPYEHCPNTRPAIALLKRMAFTNYHLLDLPNNIKTDWIARGYPVKK